MKCQKISVSLLLTVPFHNFWHPLQVPLKEIKWWIRWYRELFTMGNVLRRHADLRIAVTSRALFDLEVENEIFHNSGLDAYLNDHHTKVKTKLHPGRVRTFLQVIILFTKWCTRFRFTTSITNGNRRKPDATTTCFCLLNEFNTMAIHV